MFHGKSDALLEEPGQAALDGLADRVKGPVTPPTQRDYDQERAGFQAAYQHRPAVIVGATGVQDIRTTVQFAAERGLPIAVQSTGHGLTVAAEGGVLLNTRRMTKVRVDPTTQTARIQAGARWRDVIDEAARYGLAPLSGSSPDVGAVGYTLGGGLGLLAREYGYAVDHVRSIELVTTDGRSRRITPDSDAELFWALRGGGGNFGVVSEIEIGLLPVPRVYGGGLYFGTELIPDLLTAYRDWTPQLPDQLTSSVGLVPYPDLPMVPEPLRGRYAAHVRIVYSGDADKGERLVAPLRAVGPRLLETLGELPYTRSGEIHRDPNMPHGYYGTNALLRELPDSLLSTVFGMAGPEAPVPCVVQLNHLGGAIARPPAVPSAVSYRDAAYLLRVLAVVDGPGPSAERSAPERVIEAIAPSSLGRSPNFVMGEHSTLEQVRTCYHPDDYQRLVQVKTAYDPTNLFRFNLNIPPAQAA